MSFLVFFFPPTTPFYVKLKKVYNAKHIAHNITQNFHFPPMKTLLHFHFSSNIFLFSLGNFSHDTYPYSENIHIPQHLSIEAHKNIFVSPFFFLRGGIEFWGCTCVWTLMMYECVHECLYVCLFLTRFKLSKASTIFQTSDDETISDVHTTWSFQMNWSRRGRKNSKFNNWRVRKLSRWFTTAFFLARQNFKVSLKMDSAKHREIFSSSVFSLFEGKFCAFTHVQREKFRAKALKKFPGIFE